MILRLLFLLTALLVAAGSGTVAQGTDPDIKHYVALINNNQADEVKRELPSMLSKYPNNPGVLYLQGLVTAEGSEAVRIYQSIVDNFPKSEWADDALFKVYQFYYALGLYRTAEIKMNQLKKEYPNSSFVTGERPDTRNVPEETSSASAQVAPGAADSIVAPATPRPAQVPQSPKLQYVLQVGAYTAQANAENQKKYFETLGYPVEIISKEKENRSLFLVWLGNFPSYDSAKAEGARIKQKLNVGSIVISR